MVNQVLTSENEPFFDLRFITLIAALLLSIVSVVLSAVFGWQLGHGSLLLSITFVVMQVGLAIAEFLAASYFSIMRRLRDISGIIVSFLILISGITVNVWAGQSLIALKMSEIESERRVDSDEYKRWVVMKDKAQNKVDSFNINERQYKNAQKSVTAFERELKAYFIQSAINSNGQRAGQSIGAITSNCTDQGGWYVNKYCSKVFTITQQIEQQKIVIANYESFLTAKERLTAIEKQVPPQGATDEALPGIMNLAILSGTSPEIVKARVLIFLSLCVELFAIGLWFLLQRSSVQWNLSKPPQSGMYTDLGVQNLVESPQSLCQSSPIFEPVSTDLSSNLDFSYQKLRKMVSERSLENLSYSNIRKYIGTNNAKTKILRDRLVNDGLAQFVGETKVCVPVRRLRR